MNLSSLATVQDNSARAREQGFDSKIKTMTKLARKPVCSNIPIVLIHGWGANSRCWTELAELLNETYTLIFIDLPGFGVNKNIDIGNSETLLFNIEQILPDSCTLIGWSLGGMVATQLAHRRPDIVKHLITLATNACFVASDTWPSAVEKATYQSFFEGFETNHQATIKRFCALQAYGDSSYSMVNASLRKMNGVIDETEKKTWMRALQLLGKLKNNALMSGIRQPTMHMLGDHDALVPNAAADEIKKIAPRHHVRIFKNVGHAFHLSQPVLCAKHISNFLSADHSDYHKDKRKIARSFGRAAAGYDQVAVLQRSVAEYLVGLQNNYAGTVADLGCGTGFCTKKILNAKNHIVGIDISEGMLSYARAKIPKRDGFLHWASGDIESLPLKSNAFDGLISSLSVQWCENLPAVFSEIKRVLKNDAWCLLSTLGPNTLWELRAAWEEVDAYVHVNQFIPSEAIIQYAKDAGLLLTIFDQQEQILRYKDLITMMRELRAIGAHNVNNGQNKGLTGKQKIQRLQGAYEKYKTEAGLPSTYQVFYFLIRNSSG